MPDDDVTFKTQSGKDPIKFWVEVEDATQVHVDDALFALEMQKARILDRTARGEDVDGLPFAPYGTKRPYYWYPNKWARGSPQRNIVNSKARNNFYQKLTDDRTGKFAIDARKLGVKTKRESFGKKTLKGIKFSSYAAFKAALGRSFVDLFGPSAPHMLQAIQIRVRSAAGQIQIAMGIYGEESERARGNNFGQPEHKIPRRYFFGASTSDLAQMSMDVMKRVVLRIKTKLL